MAGGSVVFAMFLVIMMLLFIRWSIKSLVKHKKPTETVASQATGRTTNSTEVPRTAIYTITANRRNINRTDTYPDYLWDISPRASRANDIVVTKDDGDLPSYEEVMRLERERQEAIELAQTNTNSGTRSTRPSVVPNASTRSGQVPAPREAIIV